MRSLALLFALVVPLAAVHAEGSPTQAVRGYFDALGRQDFRRALAFTVAEAQKTTSHMVSTLQREAAEHGARVEVQVKEVSVASPGSPEPGRGVPVPVQFHIDVVGHKWCFQRVARTLDGQARFYVNPDVGRIVAIEGSLD